MSDDDLLWPALDRDEVELVGRSHGESTWVEARRPHERCRSCGQPFPCPSLRLARLWLLAEADGVPW